MVKFYQGLDGIEVFLLSKRQHCGYGFLPRTGNEHPPGQLTYSPKVFGLNLLDLLYCLGK